MRIDRARARGWDRAVPGERQAPLLRKFPSLVVPLALLAALSLAAAAFAVKPKQGGFVHLQKDGNESFSFVVDSGKVGSVYVSSIGCNEGEPVTVAKQLAVKGPGKFKYNGKASFLTGADAKVKLKGKFISAKKAKGSVQVKGCDTPNGPKGKIKIAFTAKWHKGG
jgi:hypothetical protein